MLIVNYVNITGINNDKYQLIRNAVSEKRRMKADCYHFISDSYRCICAELLLQYSLYQTVGRCVEMDIIYNQFGKPFMNHMDNFSFNISHSGKWVVIAYGSTEVGIDIEEIISERDNIADQFFTKEENIFIHKVTGEEKARFTQIWTLKESYIKYLGTGLSTRLDSFSVNALEGVITNQEGEIQKDLILKNYPFDTNYFLSVCSKEKDVIIFEIMLDDLIWFISDIAGSLP
ncbi:MAG: 4'-phosphopantetheinyl transferase superfamily protein [Hungatella sp.]|jgi:4'-phosphopantetheinyl transferase|nr:4'-phosphopantetheinyl transferase superfamily protein [Hungatella sp.]